MAVLLRMLCCFCLFGSYSIVKPVRDAMGTVYGMCHIEELFTGALVVSLFLASCTLGSARASAHQRPSLICEH